MSLDSKKVTRRTRGIKLIKSLQDIDLVMELMKKNKIDYAEVDGYKFTKSQHDVVINDGKIDPSISSEHASWVNPFNN